MSRDNEEARQFNKEVERLLEGGEPAAGAVGDAKTLDFARKLLQARAEPAPAFRQGLKERLLARLAAEEVAAARPRRGILDFLKGLVPQSPVWRTAAVSVAVVLLAFAISWRAGFFTAPGGLQNPPLGTITVQNVVLEAYMTVPKEAYNAGEPVIITVRLRNITDRQVRLESEPALTVADAAANNFNIANRSNPGTVAPGAIAELTFAWDQRDAAGNQAPPGDYQVSVSDLRVSEGNVQLPEPATVRLLP